MQNTRLQFFKTSKLNVFVHLSLRLPLATDQDSNTNRLALSLPRPMNRRRLKRFHPSDNWILGRPASGRLVLDSDALFATLPNFCNGPFFYYTTCKIY